MLFAVDVSFYSDLSSAVGTAVTWANTLGVLATAVFLAVSLIAWVFNRS